jgi:hypothetical protein
MGVGVDAQAVVAATPAHRDRYVDLLRAAAILAVVTGHGLTAAVIVQDGRLSGINALEVLPWARPLTWLFQVMPVFFLVGGYANAASWSSHQRRGGAGVSWVRSRMFRLLRRLRCSWLSSRGWQGFFGFPGYCPSRSC